MEEHRLNEELADLYDDNEKLFAFADKVMADCAEYRGKTFLVYEIQPQSQSIESN